MEDDNITWESDSEEHEYHKWDYRHPDFFDKDPLEYSERQYKYGIDIHLDIEHNLFPAIKQYQSKYPGVEEINNWYFDLWEKLNYKQMYFVQYVYDLVSGYKSKNDYLSYVALVDDVRILKAEFKYTKNIVIWDNFHLPQDSFEWEDIGLKTEYRLFSWKGKEHIATASKVDECIQGPLLNLQGYFETSHPEWIDAQKKASQAHLEPPYSAQRANAGQLPQIDADGQPTQFNEPMDAIDSKVNPQRGDLSFQYNVARELEIIELIQKRYKDVNGEHIGPKEIGEILSDLFKHGKPEHWSKVHGQYKTGSSNDTYRSDEQKKILKNFLTKNRLKK